MDKVNEAATRDIVGCADIAHRLDVKPQTVSMWRIRGLLPDPEWWISGVPAWRWSVIADWAERTGRVPPRPRSGQV